MIDYNISNNIKNKELYLVYQHIIFIPPVKLAKKGFPILWTNVNPYFFFTYGDTYAQQNYTENKSLNKDGFNIFSMVNSHPDFNILTEYKNYETNKTIVCLTEKDSKFKYFNFSLKFLKEHMSGIDFRDWWYKPLTEMFR